METITNYESERRRRAVLLTGDARRETADSYWYSYETSALIQKCLAQRALCGHKPCLVS
jgi:hypothetical protein